MPVLGLLLNTVPVKKTTGWKNNCFVEIDFGINHEVARSGGLWNPSGQKRRRKTVAAAGGVL